MIKGQTYKGSLFTIKLEGVPQAEAVWYPALKVATETATYKIASSLRDKMRDAYEEMVHRTDYGTYTMIGNREEDGRSLAHAIVVSKEPGGISTVGAKKGTIGNISYPDLFALMEKGNRRPEGWWFKLPENRADAAIDNDEGYWFTKGHHAKPFITQTAREYEGLPLQKDTNLYVGELIDTTFIKLGR